MNKIPLKAIDALSGIATVIHVCKACHKNLSNKFSVLFVV
jgi:hypothetical protein